ncbi:hypothetical protein AAGW05_16310 [Arthrobacter sp. LAPM80]|uniref:hypothetical protein n=1 Tax=Arthrobacter sp. LAPM80 TaxID=3141788 RepID=UPI00398B9507
MAARGDAEFIFGDSVSSLRPDYGGVDVSVERKAARRIDLVVGADGVHSTVRDTVFGLGSSFVRNLGLYIAMFSLGPTEFAPEILVMSNRPELSLSIHPVRGTAWVWFIFRGPADLTSGTTGPATFHFRRLQHLSVDIKLVSGSDAPRLNARYQAWH